MTSTSLAHVAAEQVPTRDNEAETSVSAAAAQAKASVEARYLVALHRPRNIDQVRLRLLAAARRPAFASTARYSKPVGKTRIVGPSIRFAEEAARCLTNILIETPTLYDDSERRIVRVLVTDLESNLSYSADIPLAKTVERKSVRDGQIVLGKRENSQGETTYLVAATEDELLTKQLAQCSKHIRNGVLRILPGDLLEEAMSQVVATLRAEDARDPAAARKKIVDAFFEQGVGPEQLVKYLGHTLETITEAELIELRTVFAALRDGEARWQELLEAKIGEQGAASSARGTNALKDKLARKKAAPTAGQATADEAVVEDFSAMPSSLEPTDEDLELDRILTGDDDV